MATSMEEGGEPPVENGGLEGADSGLHGIRAKLEEIEAIKEAVQDSAWTPPEECGSSVVLPVLGALRWVVHSTTCPYCREPR
jgi:hypothetical protein